MPAKITRSDFYPRPPCGGRLSVGQRAGVQPGISIHALRAEGDLHRHVGGVAPAISIHALRAEGDPPRRADGRCKLYFYPRPPCGGRPPARCCPMAACTDFYPRPPCGGRPGKPGRSSACPSSFLSTPSVRRATHQRQVSQVPISPISIHALRAEGDYDAFVLDNKAKDFYPRPPCGGRHGRPRPALTLSMHFYPRPPCGGRP